MTDPNLQLVIVIVGVALCVGGWVLFWVGSRLLGIGLGMGFGFGFGQLLIMAMDLHGSGVPLVMLSCSLLGAIGGFFLMRATTTVMFGLTGFLFGALLGRVGVQVHTVVRDVPFEYNAMVVGAILLTAGVVAVLAIWLQKSIVVMVTSYMGAGFLVTGIPAVAEHLPWSFLAIFAGAVLWQGFLVTKLIEGKPRPQPEEG